MTDREIVNKARRRGMTIFDFFGQNVISDLETYKKIQAKLDEFEPLIRADERIEILKEVYAWLSKKTAVYACLNESDWEALKKGEMPNDIPTK